MHLFFFVLVLRSPSPLALTLIEGGFDGGSAGILPFFHPFLSVTVTQSQVRSWDKALADIRCSSTSLAITYCFTTNTLPYRLIVFNSIQSLFYHSLSLHRPWSCNLR